MKMGGIRACHLIRAFALLARIGLGCLFLCSALPKIRQPYDFLHDVYNYEIVGPRLGLLIAMSLPWMELLAAVCLLSGIFISGALLVCVGMAAMFSFVVTWALYQGLDISCGCFGSGTEKITYLTLIRALIVLLLSTAAYVGVFSSSPQTHWRTGRAENKNRSTPLIADPAGLLP
jgi:uncharacterized membrane protein YphA (DoxX/SURF4 family)